MGDPRYRPAVSKPRPCDYGRTPMKPAYTCKGEDGKPSEGKHRWQSVGGSEINLCDPHDVEATRATGDTGKLPAVDRSDFKDGQWYEPSPGFGK